MNDDNRMKLRMHTRALDGMLAENRDPANTRHDALGPIEIDALEFAVAFLKGWLEGKS